MSILVGFNLPLTQTQENPAMAATMETTYLCPKQRYTPSIFSPVYYIIVMQVLDTL